MKTNGTMTPAMAPDPAAALEDIFAGLVADAIASLEDAGCVFQSDGATSWRMAPASLATPGELALLHVERALVARLVADRLAPPDPSLAGGRR